MNDINILELYMFDYPDSILSIHLYTDPPHDASGGVGVHVATETNFIHAFLNVLCRGPLHCHRRGI